ncbi:MAG: BrnT family toxin [Myxococcota bacterium]
MVQFTWDPRKVTSNLRKHGVSFEEATTVFADPLAVVVEDALYAERAILIGQSEKQRVLFTVFVELNADSIRIISARRATSHERRRYEEGES